MKTIQLRRVVVTGLGAATDLGIDVDTTWKNLLEGQSGIGRLTAFSQSEAWTVNIAGQVSEFDIAERMDPREAKRVDRAAILAMWAGVEAARDSGIDFTTGDQFDRGVAVGSGIGGVSTMEAQHEKIILQGPRKLSPFTVPRLMVNAAAGNLSILLGLRGSNTATATACASGAHSIGAAFHLIQRGDAKVMVAGGTEAAVTPLCIAAFAKMKALSTRNDDPTRASRPFDRDRDGFVLAEGAGIIVMEDLEHAKARGAKIYAEISGLGTTGDAGHIAAPDENGTGAHEAMRRALAAAELNVSDIDYVNAHGTSTPLGDRAEVAALKRLFGSNTEHLLVGSTKSMTGHTLGAAGGLETIFTVKAIHESVAPPTINLENPDEGFDLDFIANEARPGPIRAALNNSFGFGGHNVSMALQAFVD